MKQKLANAMTSQAKITKNALIAFSLAYTVIEKYEFWWAEILVIQLFIQLNYIQGNMFPGFYAPRVLCYMA